MPTVASLLVKIGANDQEIQNALTSVGLKAKSVDADLKKLGNSPLAQNAQKSLDSLKQSMELITKAQERVADRARNMAAGLEQMGGVSRLTDAQLKQVNRTLQEGVSAFRALGKDAPAELQKVADAVADKLDKPMGLIQSKAIALGTAIGTFLGNAAIQDGREMFEAGKQAFNYADSLTNLSQTTGIGVEALQRLEAIGTTSGVSLETLANAVGQLQKRLDDPAAISALRQMGLNYQAIRALKPEDQFYEISSAVAAIEDPVERMNAGTALFGRQWATIAPAVTKDMRDIVTGVNALSKEQIAALDRAGDRWDLWVKERERDIARFLGSIVLAIEKTEELNKLKLSPDFEQAQQLEGLLAQAGMIAPNGPAPRRLPIAAGPTRNDAFDSSVALYGKTLEQQLATTEKQIQAEERLKTVRDQLFGRAIIANAEMLVKALGDDENLTRLTAESTKKLNTELGQAIEVYRRLGQDVPPKLQEIYDKTLQLQQSSITPPQRGMLIFNESIPENVIMAARDYSKVLSGTGIEVNRLGNAVEVNLMPSLHGLTKTFDEGEDEAKGFKAALTESLGGLNAIFQSAFEGGGGAKGAIQSFATGLLKKGLEMIPVVGKFISQFSGAIVAGVKKLYEAVSGRAGRNLVKEFAEQFGGFDNLREQLNALGEEGERMWIRLTQGTRAGDAEGAKRAIEDVQEAMARAKEQFTEAQGILNGLGGKLTGLTVITPELEAALDRAFSANNTKDFLATVTDINAELEKQQAKFAAVEDALSRYGIKFEDAGKQFQQAKINERAQQLVKDFEALIGAGTDVNVVMRGMGQTIRDFIKDAQKTGTEVPDAIQRIIQTAIDAGEVFDENGNKITDITKLGLTFGSTMQQVTEKVASAMERLNVVLEALAKFLGVVLPNAAATGADRIQKELDSIDPPDITVPVTYDYHNEPSGFTYGEGRPGDIPGAATGGLVTARGIQRFQSGGFARGTDTIPAMLTPGELVLNAAQQQNLAASMSKTADVHFHFHGAVLAEKEYVEKYLVVPLLEEMQRNHIRTVKRIVTLAEQS